MSTEIKALETVLTRQARSYHGKFRAFVVDNADPEGRGRLRLTIPSVLGAEPSDWALPCFPYGGGAGFGWIAVPPVDSQVVAEFIEGDISSPIWTGTFHRTAGEVPEEAGAGTAASTKLLKTEAGHLLSFEDAEGEETVILRSAKDAVVEMNAEGSIALTGSDGGTVVLDAAAGTLTVEDANGNALVLSSSGIEATDATGNSISMTSGGIEVSAATITIKGSQVTIGEGSAEPLVKGQSFMSIFNAHVHNATSIGAPTSPPLTPMTPAVMTTATKGA